MNWSLALHGGAGTIRAEDLTPERATQYRDALIACLRAGEAVLAADGSAMDAVTATVAALEDDERFNAGRGAVLTTDGTVEHDAAVMRGADRAFGGVIGICGPKNPVRAAAWVLEHAPPVLMAGPGAIRALRRSGLPFLAATEFVTDRQRLALAAEMARRTTADAPPAGDAQRHGTVGAVALDRAGHLAAATSTGGMTGKRPGRVGDSPIPGAGVFADWTCAVSCTGTGEVFLRHLAAHEISARIRWNGQDIFAAADGVMAALAADGGNGGLIAMDVQGRVTMPFNSRGMYRATLFEGGEPYAAIHQD